MKQQLLHLLMLLLSVFAAGAQELTVCTYNVRYKNSGDTDAGNGWNTRRTYLVNFVNFQMPDLLGVQEATKAQMTDMNNGLKGYAYIGVGRNDGAEAGEYSAIFYNKESMVLLDHGNFWLSDTPYQPSKGFPSKGGGTSYYRICTWGKFFHKASGTVVYHFNTHMDLDETNRQQSYYLIKKVIEEMDIKTAPVMISGDYNAVQTGDAYKLFYNSGFLYDCYNKAKQRFMTNGTCPGFNAGNYSVVGSELRRIDHIFVTKAFNVEHYAVMNPCYYSTSGTADYHERAYSDHSPVLVKLTLRNPEMAELSTTPPPSEGGVYQISTAADLLAFSRIVNGLGGYVQNTKAKAALTADIDLDSEASWLPIGREGAAFGGTFDGQGHSIRNLHVKGHSSCSGLFGKVSGATIQNFSVGGDVTFGDGTGIGVVGWAEGSTIKDVHSELNIAVTSVAHHIGGVCGSLRTGSKVVRCSFSGSITDTAGSTDCLGGVVGYTNENCSLEHCANYGSVSFTAEGAYAGGLFGYVNNTSFAGVKNSLSTGEVKMSGGGTPTYSGAIGGRVRSYKASAFANNYWLEGSAVRVSGEITVPGQAVSALQLASGEICYSLNGDQQVLNWYQTLGADPFPVLWDDHLKVLLRDGSYVNDGADAIRDIKGREDFQHFSNTEDLNDLCIYNLAGQRLWKTQQGINIINGEKYLQK